MSKIEEAINNRAVLIPVVVFLLSINLLLLLFIFDKLQSPDNSTPPINQTPPATPTISRKKPQPTTDVLPSEKNQITETALDELPSDTRSNFSVVGHRVFKGWAIASIVPETIIADSANIILKKEGNSWSVVAGPQTYFEEEELRGVGAPGEIIELANIIPLIILDE